MSDPSPIPQASPGRDYGLQADELDRAILDVTRSGRYILGDEVAAFEREFAAYLQVTDCVGVGNGTDAVELALRGAGIGPGSLVATVSHTAVATIAAIERTGARPLFVDVDPVTMTMDVQQLEDAVRSRENTAEPVSAVVVVHLYGQPADIESIVRIGVDRDVRVIEDCAQAHGALAAGRHIGSFGDVAAFSFYPTKNLPAVGDGGMVATSRPAIAERVRALRQYGWRRRQVSEEPGFNSRLDELQAAVLRVRLRSLDVLNDRRARIADAYDAALAETSLVAPSHVPATKRVFHQYVVRTKHRDRLARELMDRGIHTAIHYPVPVHLQPAYRDRIRQAAALPVTEALANEILSLPMFPALLDSEVDRVSDALRELAGREPSRGAIH